MKFKMRASHSDSESVTVSEWRMGHWIISHLGQWVMWLVSLTVAVYFTQSVTEPVTGWLIKTETESQHSRVKSDSPRLV